MSQRRAAAGRRGGGGGGAGSRFPSDGTQRARPVRGPSSAAAPSVGSGPPSSPVSRSPPVSHHTTSHSPRSVLLCRAPPPCRSLACLLPPLGVFLMWLTWVCCWLHQWHPLIRPIKLKEA